MSVELFLNIVWVVVAAAVLGTWRINWVHQRKRTLLRSIWEWTSICVVLVLLFFAVSMTDDLHSDLIVFEECSSSRRNSVLVVAGPEQDSSVPALHTDFAVAAPPVASLDAPLHALHVVEPFTPRIKYRLDGDTASSRAPPFVA